MASDNTSSPPPKSPRLRRVQITSLVLLVLIGAINYIDRATLAIANPLIREELGLSVADMGLLLSAFLGAYALAQLPAGLIVDRFGPRLVLALSLAIWSLAQMVGGFVRGFGQFFTTRAALGIGEAPQFPANVRVVCDWFGKSERGFATGVWNSASTLGTAISAPLLTFLMLRFGWRTMFIIMGVVGLVVAATFYALYRNPAQTGLTEDEKRYLADSETPAPRQPITLREWAHLFRFRTTWGMIFGFSGTVYLLWIYNAWLPSYLQMERHFTIAKTGWVAAIPFVFGIFGSLSGGHLCDYLVRSGVSPMLSRKGPMVIARCGAELRRLLRRHARPRAHRFHRTKDHQLRARPAHRCSHRHRRGIALPRARARADHATQTSRRPVLDLIHDHSFRARYRDRSRWHLHQSSPGAP